MSGTGSAARSLAVFSLAFVLTALPVFSTVLPPILDYPNHLARMHILAEAGASATLGQFYTVQWAPLPNLAMDLIVPPLSAVLPLEAAGKIFLLLIFALMAGGTVWLHRVVHGRWSLWPLLVFLLIYNRILLWGFLNYLFGLGLALCALALWLAERERPAWRRILLSSPLALAIYFSHISAFGIYAVLLAGIEATAALALLRRRAELNESLSTSVIASAAKQSSAAAPKAGLLRYARNDALNFARFLRARQWRRLAVETVVAAVQFLAPAALVLGSWRHSAEGNFAFANYWRKADLLFSVFDNYNRGFDIVCFALFVLLLLALAACRRLVLAPVMRLPLLFLVLAYLAMPSQLLSGSGADHRMPVAIFLVLLAGTVPRWSRPGVANAIAAGLALLFAARLAVVERVWAASDAQYRADIAVLDTVPKGAKLAVAWPGSAIQVTAAPELHLPNLAIIRRDAFVPTLFAYPAQQPVALTPDYAALADAVGQQALWDAAVTGRSRLPPALKAYDYVVLIDRTPFLTRATDCLTPVNPGATFHLLAVNQDCAELQ